MYLYSSYENELKGFHAKQGSYGDYLFSIQNGQIAETKLYEGYAQGDYPPINGEKLKGLSPDDLNALDNSFCF